VLQEVEHFDVHERREVIARDQRFAARPVGLADVKQRLAESLVGAGVRLRILFVVACLDRGNQLGFGVLAAQV
jgi:hypothetical protein